jgi:hydrogenase maturation protease
MQHDRRSGTGNVAPLSLRVRNPHDVGSAANRLHCAVAAGEGLWREGVVTKVLVLGVGNSLLTDDGVGVHAVARLRLESPMPPDVTILDAGTLSFSLLPALEQSDALIAIDAARGGGEPGEVQVREGDEVERFLQRNGRSVHEVGLSDLLDMARLSGQLPGRRVLIGVEPQVIDWGLELSAPVAAALPRCVDLAVEFIGRWQATEASRGN